MAVFTANAVQTVPVGQSLLFTETRVCGNNSIIHTAGSGQVTLRGIAKCQCRARYQVTFSGNIAIATGGAAGPIAIAIASDGEAIAPTTMIVTPAAVGDYFNVSATIPVDVPIGCCTKISVKNISTPATQTVDVQNAILTVERIA